MFKLTTHIIFDLPTYAQDSQQPIEKNTISQFMRKL